MKRNALWMGLLLWLTGSAVFAQNNTSTVDQTGAAKNADVTQQGQQLRSLVRQSGATGPSGATVVQQGGNATVGNNSTVIQTNNSTGTNTAMVSQTQTGTGANSVSLTQTNTGATTNSATVSQSGQNLNATSLQNGAGHTLNIVQTGDGSNAITNQQTTGNLISVTQAAGSAGSPNQVYIQQLSGDNKVYATQFGATTQGNGLTVTQQTGNMNEVGTSTNPFYQSGNGNTATITQSGTSNKVFSFSQTNGTTGTGVNSAILTQSGQSNTITTVSQSFTGTGANNRLIINQNGPGNIAGSNAAGTVVGITQVGNGNSLTLNQTNTTNTISNGNLAFALLQNGAGNTATISQSGTNGIVARLNQVGNNNSLIADQRGNDNTIGGTDIDAYGNNNQYVLSQKGSTGNNIDITNPNLTTTGNDNNTVVVTQDVGRNHQALADLRASGSNISITQAGSASTTGFNSARFTIRNQGGLQTANSTAGQNNTLVVNQTSTATAAGQRNLFNGEARGDANWVNIFQNGTTNTIGGTGISQRGLIIVGNNNRVSIEQGTSGVPASGNSVNMTIGLTTPSNVGTPSNLNVVNIAQTGAGNSVGTGTGATTGLVITGVGSNSVNITQAQSGASGNAVNMNIEGTGVGSNSVSITQTGSGNSVGTGGGVASRGLSVTGASNRVGITQTGDNNVATAIVNGNSNTLLVGQTGNTNLASVTQTTNNSYITLTQDGADVATLKQLGAGTANKIYLNQGSLTGINTATINQTGDKNYVGGLNTSYAAPGVANQIGLGGNTATINQTYTGAAPVGQVTLFQQNGSNNVLNVMQNTP